jgi:acyl-CoA reductase-like NAD-dependent aldehyde dehydrogenase
MRIAGKTVETDQPVEVLNPTTARWSAPSAARPEHVREAFAKAKAFKPKLTRYERQQILLKTADLLAARKEEFARIITAESGLCWKDSLYEAGRAYDVYSFAGQLTIRTTARPTPAISLRRASSARSSPRAIRSAA